MLEIKILSKGQINDYKCILDKDTLVISFYNSTDITIVHSQELSVTTNPTIIEYKDNIFCLKRDDIQNLKNLNLFKHYIIPYKNVFSTRDLINVLIFLEKKDYKNKKLIFQCEYGRSRSASLALSLHKYFLKNTHYMEYGNNGIIYNKVIEYIVDRYFKK